MDNLVTSEHKFVICVRNDKNPASLLLRKIYEVMPDPEGAKFGLIRVIDESGEDYLFPNIYFKPLELPQDVVEAILQTA
jgi:hypothetical protein